MQPERQKERTEICCCCFCVLFLFPESRVVLECGEWQKEKMAGRARQPGRQSEPYREAEGKKKPGPQWNDKRINSLAGFDSTCLTD